MQRQALHDRFATRFFITTLVAHPTQREKEILMCMATGLTSVQTGHRLGISTKTVETHRKNLQRKFNAINACQLVYLATKAGHI